MKTPYCKIDGVKYQLYWVNGVLRFPDDGRPMPDLNMMQFAYLNGLTDRQQLFDYDINSGSSYEFVYGRYSKYGSNAHSTKEGDHKKFQVYKGKKP